jgi:hypothetical protein
VTVRPHGINATHMAHPIPPAYGGVFVCTTSEGRSRLTRHPEAPSSLADPATGRALRISTVEVAGAICPSCDERSEGGFVSFEADLRMVYACPECEELVWIDGA